MMATRSPGWDCNTCSITREEHRWTLKCLINAVTGNLATLSTCSERSAEQLSAAQNPFHFPALGQFVYQLVQIPDLPRQQLVRVSVVTPLLIKTKINQKFELDR